MKRISLEITASKHYLWPKAQKYLTLTCRQPGHEREVPYEFNGRNKCWTAVPIIMLSKKCTCLLPQEGYFWGKQDCRLIRSSSPQLSRWIIPWVPSIIWAINFNETYKNHELGMINVQWSHKCCLSNNLLGRRTFL